MLAKDYAIKTTFKKVFYLSNSFAISTNAFHSNVSNVAFKILQHKQTFHMTLCNKFPSFRGVLMTLSNIYNGDICEFNSQL